MDYSNVIPIDAEVARLIERRRTRFRWLVAAVASLWITVLIPTLLLTPLPPLGTFAILAVLAVLAEHRFIVFGDETSMSASIIVVIASIFVFADTSPLAGPMLIASLGGLYLPLLRARAFAKSVFNGASFCLSAATATAILHHISAVHLSSIGPAFTATLVASSAYWCANSILTGSASSAQLGTNLLESVREQITSEWPTMLLAIAGGLIGITLGNDGLLFAPALALLVGLFEKDIQQRRTTYLKGRTARLHASSALLGLTAVAFHTSISGAAIASMGAFIFASTQRQIGTSSLVSGGMPVLAVCAATLFVGTLTCPALEFILYTMLSVISLTSLALRPRSRCQRMRDGLVYLGVALPNRSEFAIAAGTASALGIAHRLMSESGLVMTTLVGVLAFSGLARIGALSVQKQRSQYLPAGEVR